MEREEDIQTSDLCFMGCSPLLIVLPFGVLAICTKRWKKKEIIEESNNQVAGGRQVRPK